MNTRRHQLTDPLPDAELLLLTFLAGCSGLAGSFAIVGFTPSFIAGAIAGFLARYLPAPIITFAIVVLGDLGEQLNVIMAFALSIVILAVAAGIGLAIATRLNAPQLGPLAAGVLGGFVTFGITRTVLPSITAGLAILLVLGIANLLQNVTTPVPMSPHRRRVLGGTITALVMIASGGVLGSQRPVERQRQTGSRDLSLPNTIRQEIPRLLTEADDKSLAVENLEPLISTDFYRVDINAADPTIDPDDYELRVTGAVDEEKTYSYADITSRTPENRFNTLRCVGEQLNGKKMDNALWTGFPIMELVDPAIPEDRCCVMLRAADGYFEEFPLAALQNGFIAYAMNGEPLPRGHGYPVRALIPGHWGEINVKWLTEIEILEEEQDGYWEQRGWHGTGPVNTVAKLHVVNHLDDGRIQVAGHAYAGTRDISRVEVSIDGGETWTDAILSDPLPGDDVWRQWQYTYTPPIGAHEVVVRATDGAGALQPQEEASPFPNGPSGWVSRMVRQ